MPIEPLQTPDESTLKFAGRCIRTAVSRSSYAECQEEDCPGAWIGPSAIVASGMHTVGTGHIVLQHYEAVYQLEPNPDGSAFTPMGAGLQKQRRAQAHLKALAEEQARDIRRARKTETEG